MAYYTTGSDINEKMSKIYISELKDNSPEGTSYKLLRRTHSREPLIYPFVEMLKILCQYQPDIANG